MRALKLWKNWFTLVEVVLVTSIFAIVVVWIILAINRSFVFIDNTRLSVRAANFAREWMEMMYNLRDTNWRKHSWTRDKYWLNVWLWENFFQKWIYVLKEKKSEDNNKFIFADKITELASETEVIDDFYSSDGFWKDGYAGPRSKAKLTFSWEYSYYESKDGGEALNTWSIQDVLVWNWLEFYRIVRIFEIYCKDSDITSDTSSCVWDDNSPKEMRFCVKVFYASQWKHATELCGIMTNFME